MQYRRDIDKFAVVWECKIIQNSQNKKWPIFPSQSAVGGSFVYLCWRCQPSIFIALISITDIYSTMKEKINEPHIGTEGDWRLLLRNSQWKLAYPRPLYTTQKVKMQSSTACMVPALTEILLITANTEARLCSTKAMRECFTGSQDVTEEQPKRVWRRGTEWVSGL